MAEVGIRELRNHLSRYLARVRRGEEILVTDRGRAVARVVPVDQPRPFDRLVAEGLIEPAETTTRSRAQRRIKSSGSVSDLVGEQRR